jgi:hypothetical protein
VGHAQRQTTPQASSAEIAALHSQLLCSEAAAKSAVLSGIQKGRILVNCKFLMPPRMSSAAPRFRKTGKEFQVKGKRSAFYTTPYCRNQS